MKRKIIHFIIFIVCITGCSQEITTVTIVRKPVIKFDVGATAWRASNYSVTNIARVVVYPSDTTQPGQLYNRLTMQASGKDDAGSDLQLILNFDVTDPNILIGSYTTTYSTQRGLAQVQLYNLTNSNNLVAYELCKTGSPQALFQVQKQNPAERLITGIFQMTLCNARDTMQKIRITNGTFTDIKY